MQLIEIETTDKLVLPGLFFEPKEKSKKALIYLHGNGSSSIFYSVKKINLFAQELNKIDISFLPFNNRGAHYIKTLKKQIGDKDERLIYGTTYELIKECIHDIDGAINFLKKRGYSELYLAGSSTGANKVCLCNYYKPENKIKGYILLSGGDDTGIYYKQLGDKKFWHALNRAHQHISKGQGARLVPKSIVDYLLSYQSLYDTLNPNGSYNIFPYYETFLKRIGTKKLFQEYKSIRKPTLVVYGEFDEYCYDKVPEIIELLKEQTTVPKKFEFKIIPEADHGFDGKEKELVSTITSWLKTNV